ncbi:MAG: serine/threonine protein kinase [Myxococcales bacterium]|nr:serine/threonine protein kinase [Myxococcales bacterium]
MEALAATSRVGKYQLLELLGSGGMAEVWRATVRGAAGFHKEVALKTIRKEWARDAAFVTMFVDEARLSSTLAHPNIVATLDFGFAEGRYFLAMEMVDGVSLRACQRFLARRGWPLGVELATHVAAEMAAALHYAHHARDRDGRPLEIVHRDVNPTNVMISTHGEVKLTDFGIAKAAGRATQTEAGALKGKIPYMSPEQAWGKPLDGRADVFALGLTLYELVTGAYAIDGENEIEMLERARAAAVPSLALVAPELAPILARACARDPEARFATAGELRTELMGVLAQAPRHDLAAELAALAREVKRSRTTGMMPALVASAEPESATPAGTTAGPGREATETGSDPGAALRSELAARRLVPATVAARPSALPLAEPATVEPTPAAWRRRWPVVAVAGLGAAGLAGMMLASRGDPAGPPPTMAPKTAASPSTAPSIAPEIARPPLLGVAAKPPPLPTVVRPTHRPPTVKPATPTTVASGDERATLRIRIEPWGTAWLDDRDLGMSPLPPVQVAPGSHTLVARNPTLGTRRVTFTVAAGEGKLVHLDFGKGTP